MESFKADLHIHSVLSPCANLEMSPTNIVDQALKQKLDIIAVADHNSTLHCPLVRDLALRNGIFAVNAVEVNTREEVHCLCLFDTEGQRVKFQNFIEESIQRVPNNPDIFGYQVVVNEQEEILDEIDYLLHSALRANIDEVEKRVHELGGIFIPAHVDRLKFSITSQLGFIPPNLNYDALEVSKNSTIDAVMKNNPLITRKRFIRNSDAHTIEQIGSSYSTFRMEKLNFENLKNAIMGINGCEVLVEF